jgi:hypothetical protein
MSATEEIGVAKAAYGRDGTTATESFPREPDTARPTAAHVEVNEVTERRVRRKLDRVVIPLTFACYLCAFLDRSNIGNAQTAGMGKDLGFDDSHYQWLLTMFYIPYIIFEWAAIMWKLVPPRECSSLLNAARHLVLIMDGIDLWAFVTVLTWGVASTLQAAAFNWQGLMVCRWFMAMAEAAFAPGIPYLLSFFYRRHELGLRCGIFLSAAPLATTFAGALAYGITSGHPSIPNWKLLFLVEGIPTVAMAVLAYFFLPDSPETAKFLTPEEKDVAKARAIMQTGHAGTERVGGVNLKDVLSTFKEPQTLIQPLMYFSCNVSFASLPVFLPAILTTMGYSSINAQGLTAPPYFLSFLVCIATTYIADRTQQRGLMIAGLSIMGGVGYVLLATVHTVGVRYLGVFLAAAGVFPAIANILPWVLNDQGTDTKRGVGIAMLNIMGQCGPLLGTRVFPVKEKPFYVKGMSICAAFMFFNAILALGLRTYFAAQNRRLERWEREMGATAVAQRDEKLDIRRIPTEIEGVVGYRYVL